MSKWLNRDRKRSKKTTARRIDSQYREKGQGKDSDQKKRDAQFRKSLDTLAEELADMLNN
tara:strand:- start:211 stop:390 length:180 start_codon:yes stop_codon:yes gene_type:complete